MKKPIAYCFVSFVLNLGFLTLLLNANSAFAAAPIFESINTGLCDIKQLGTLTAKETPEMPYFLIAAKACKGANTDRTLFLFKGDGKWSTHFVPPGKILDPKTRKVVFESRAFFGKCLNAYDQIYVSFQKEPSGKRGKIQSSVFIGEIAKDFFREKLLEAHFPKITETTSLVKKKLCTEIETRNRVALSKPLDLNPRLNTEDEEDDEDEIKKEN